MSLFLALSKKYTMIEEFKDKLKGFKNKLKETEKLKLLREQEINQIKSETKRKLNMLDDEINDILEKFRSNHPEVFLRKGVLRICSKFTGEHPCRRVISLKLLATLLKSRQLY